MKLVCLDHVYIMLDSFSDSTKTILLTRKNDDLSGFNTAFLCVAPRGVLILKVDGHISCRFLCLSLWRCELVFMPGRSIFFFVDMMSYPVKCRCITALMKQMKEPFSLVCKNKHF